MEAVIKRIEYHLPSHVLSNDELAATDTKWTAGEIAAKTGIVERRLAAADECASDLAVAASRKLFASGVCRAEDIDYLLFCTQAPDYPLPTTACLLQERLGLPRTCGALDFNLGCSGFVYGLGMAKGLVETGQARHVLLLTADTYSKYIHPMDMNVRTLFGDAGAATLVEAREGEWSDGAGSIGPFVFGTDGRGAANLMVAAGGARDLASTSRSAPESAAAKSIPPPRLAMNGPEIFSFTLEAVPAAVSSLLERCQLRSEDVDLFVFHQANKFILDHLRKKLRIPPERFYMWLSHCGNTVSSSIPIALTHALLDGRVQPGSRVVLVGFGVGYSWAATLVQWASC